MPVDVDQVAGAERRQAWADPRFHFRTKQTSIFGCAKRIRGLGPVGRELGGRSNPLEHTQLCANDLHRLTGGFADQQ